MAKKLVRQQALVPQTRPTSLKMCPHVPCVPDPNGTGHFHVYLANRCFIPPPLPISTTIQLILQPRPHPSPPVSRPACMLCSSSLTRYSAASDTEAHYTILQFLRLPTLYTCIRATPMFPPPSEVCCLLVLTITRQHHARLGNFHCLFSDRPPK